MISNEDLFYIDGIAPADSVADDKAVETTASGSSSASSTNTTFKEDPKLVSRVESLEKYVSDIQENTIRKNSDASLKSLTLTDRIIAFWGKIGGWLIENGKLSTSKIEIDSNNERIRSTNYSPGVSGFTIQSDLVEAENLKARGSLQGATFAYDKVSAVGGQLMVTNADTLAENMSSLDNSVMVTKGDTDFAVNDFLVMRGVATSGVEEEWMKVISIDGDTYTVLRDVKGDFDANENPAWKAGTPVVKQGYISSTSGNTYIAPTVTGGTSPSATTVFDTLAKSTNDGKIKLTINGYDYDNVIIDFSNYDTETDIVSGSGALVNGTGVETWQTFKTGVNQTFLTTIMVSIYKSSGETRNATLKLRLTNSTGEIIHTSDPFTVEAGGGYKDATVTFNVEVLPNTTYCIHYDIGFNYSLGYLNSWYADGTCNITGKDWRFGVKGKNHINHTETTIAATLQTAIRATTGRLETVAYSTDHYLVTGVDPDITIDIDSPSTGTDISGSGATKYYDLGSGATDANGGFGAGGWLRLIGEGTNSPYYSVFKRTGLAYNNYVETCRLGNLNGFLDYATNEYGIALGDNSANLCYDPTNGFRLRGVSENWFDVSASDNIRTSCDGGNNETSDYVKVNEVLYNDISGTIRIFFDLWHPGGVDTAYGRIYKNGVAYGTERSTSGGYPGTEYTENLAFATGDLIQLYLKNGNTNGMQLRYDKGAKPETNTINL